MKRKNLRKMTVGALFLALGIVLPFFTGQIKEVGNMLLPMHIPVMLCGLICGKWYGLGVGAALPIIRSMACAMPTLYPTALAMAFELATYGFVVGLLYEKSNRKCVKSLYCAMLWAMLSGRAVWGAVMCALLGINNSKFGFSAFLSAAFFNAVPGIVLQLIIVPSVMVALEKAKLVPLANVGGKECE